MTDKYILDGRKVVPWEGSHEEWTVKVFGPHDRAVAQDEIGDVLISTVFLGLDHSFGRGPPLVFETMIFGGAHDGYQTRTSTWDEAERQHAEAVAMARSGLN